MIPLEVKDHVSCQPFFPCLVHTGVNSSRMNEEGMNGEGPQLSVCVPIQFRLAFYGTAGQPVSREMLAPISDHEVFHL